MSTHMESSTKRERSVLYIVSINPNAALTRATFLGQLMTGVGGTGSRPIIAENRVHRREPQPSPIG